MNKSVFISYSSKDERYIKKMTQMLEKMGITYWIAPDMIPAGSNYAREIPSAIQNCDIFLLVLSKASQQSIWVEKEIDSAIYYRKTIVPFQIDDSPMTDMFRFYLNNVQTIYCANRPKDAIEELKQRLRTLLKLTAESIHNPGGKKDRGESSTSKEETTEGRDSENKDAPTEQESEIAIARRKRESFLRSSGIPTACGYCGGDLEKISRGVYRCRKCGRENYDYFQTVRNFLRKYGAKPAIIIERETGVPRHVIEQFVSDEYLEIPKLEPMRLSCVKCGASIRTGTLCENCKNARPQKPARSGGSWHSSRR
ncbi:TIR domain-containing protein [Roseburia sp. AM59-24XD]|uniref:TIR domain-containing protein n=1 Tax=Roseburia sp. AM59-24XD TaxID=2293138 RepID=UPI001FA94793|nr:TIR domain-containing protein [Roseburia sp. AM59-24XD]